MYNLASFLRDHNTIDERPRRTQANSKNDESAISKCRFSQTRIMDEVRTDESKCVITNSVFPLAFPYIYLGQNALLIILLPARKFGVFFKHPPL